VDLSVAPLARLALGVGHRQARNGRGLASCGLSFVLDLEGALPTITATFALDLNAWGIFWTAWT
jgi:hypothetical protein